MAYCTQQPMQQPDGSMSTLSYLPVGTPEHDSRYASATAAVWSPGVGMTCPTTAAAGAAPAAPGGGGGWRRGWRR